MVLLSLRNRVWDPELDPRKGGTGKRRVGGTEELNQTYLVRPVDAIFLGFGEAIVFV